jgi:predicted ArsR family transcriptional regulator
VTSAHTRTDTRRLGRLVGRTRAVILDLLRQPRSTDDVARELALAPSTVSGHLTTLTAIGVASRIRSRHRVCYELNDDGLELLRIFESDNGDSDLAQRTQPCSGGST